MESHLGLGYCHSQSQVPVASASASDNADNLMQHYLQQCLVYHEEQEEVRRNQVAAVPLAETETQFVPSSVKIETDESEPFHLQEEAPIAFKNATAQLIPNTSLVKQAEEGRLRVQAILQRFQHQQEKLFQAHPLVAAAANVDANGDECRHNEDGIIDGEPLSIYREQRIAGLQREETRKHAALLKNLEYVAARENERYQQLMVQAKKTRQHQQHIHDRSQNVLEERKRAQFAAGTKLKSQRGVGAGRRTTIDSVKQAKTHAPGGQQQEEREQSSVAIYLSGIPTNDTVGDGMLRQLFSSYGKILKLHFYRNKKTGQLKGDGLIVYQVSSKERGNDLIQLVRSQMNGAELPCGSVLRVEPADSNGTLTLSQYGTEHDASGAQMLDISGEVCINEGKTTEEADEDLDSFFNSL